MASFQIAKGRAVSYKDGSGRDRLAFPGDEDKLTLSAEQEAALRKAKVITDAPEPQAATPSAEVRESASEATPTPRKGSR